jgi:hypothetical protein
MVEDGLRTVARAATDVPLNNAIAHGNAVNGGRDG